MGTAELSDIRDGNGRGASDCPGLFFNFFIFRKGGRTFARLLQFRVLGLGLFQDRDVGVGVFPQREKILVCRARLLVVTSENIGAGKRDVRQRAERRILNY